MDYYTQKAIKRKKEIDSFINLFSKTFILLIPFLGIIFLLTVCAPAHAAPSETECQVTNAVNSPTGQVLSTVGILGGIVNPVAGTLALVTSSYRGSLCPRPELITREQAQKMIEDALSECLNTGCPKTLIAKD